MRVLAALSQDASRTACAEFLSYCGWDVDSTTDPSVAQRFLAFRDYDAVVTDAQFNGWNSTEGLDIARAAKRRGRDPVVVVLATSVDDTLLEDARAAGADVTWPKPQRLDVIAAFVSKNGTDRLKVTQAAPPALH